MDANAAVYYVIAEFKSGDREWYGPMSLQESKEKIALLKSIEVDGKRVWG